MKYAHQTLVTVRSGKRESIPLAEWLAEVRKELLEPLSPVGGCRRFRLAEVLAVEPPCVLTENADEIEGLLSRGQAVAVTLPLALGVSGVILLLPKPVDVRVDFDVKQFRPDCNAARLSGDARRGKKV